MNKEEVQKRLDSHKKDCKTAHYLFDQALNKNDPDLAVKWFAEEQKYNTLIAYYTGKLKAF